jgi:hypothetical protein
MADQVVLGVEIGDIKFRVNQAQNYLNINF